MQRRLVAIVVGVIVVAMIGAVVGAIVQMAIYNPALKPAPGMTGYWVTEPGSFGASVAKSWARFSEERTCEYELLGWTIDNVLYFREVCGLQGNLVAVDPVSGTQSKPEAGDATPELVSDVVPNAQALALVRSGPTIPASFEPEIRSVELRGDGLRSVDGAFVALIARHVYGPEDVLIVWQDAK